LPGLYFTLVLPETRLLGPALLGLAAACGLLSLRSLLRRQALSVDARALEARRMGRTLRLAWRDVVRVDRSRRRFKPLMAAAIALARGVVRLAARNDGRVIAFDWHPRVPEYLTLRGAGRQIRIALHRLPRPDDLLAWIEFYESVGRKAAGGGAPDARPEGRPSAVRQSVPLTPVEARPLRESVTAPAPAPTAGAVGARGPSAPSQEQGPLDPWAAGVGEFPGMAGSGGLAGTAADEAADWGAVLDDGEADAWLRAEPSDVPGTRRKDAGAANVGGRSGVASHEATPPPPGRASPPTPALGAEAVRGERPAPAGGGAGSWSGSVERLWPPSAPLERSARDSAPTEPPARAWYQPVPDLGPDEFSWPTMEDEAEPASGAAQPQDQPAESGEGLAESFAPWRDNHEWQPPLLPRFGPPAAGSPGEQTHLPAEGTGDSGTFDTDDLRRR